MAVNPAPELHSLVAVIDIVFWKPAPIAVPFELGIDAVAPGPAQ
jgi:hypothetical protein